MEPIHVIQSIAVPWLQPDVDTDVITPMRRVINNMDQLGRFSFEPYRFLGGDGDAGVLNPEFPLNMPQYQNARILIAGENFGCGSSRETAADAVRDCGLQCILGSSFSTIFYKNCCQKGVLPVILPKEIIQQFAQEADGTGEFLVDLENCTVVSPSGVKICFTMNEYRRQGLLQGLDDIGLTLQKEMHIQAFYDADQKKHPWKYIAIQR